MNAKNNDELGNNELQRMLSSLFIIIIIIIQQRCILMIRDIYLSSLQSICVGIHVPFSTCAPSRVAKFNDNYGTTFYCDVIVEHYK